MFKTIILSILLSCVLAAAWAIDTVRYHEPKGLQPFHGDLFDTVSLRIETADRSAGEDLSARLR